MVTVLQLNRLELKEMITQEIVKNPVLEEATEEAGEEITPEELLPLLEAEATTDPADRQILEATSWQCQTSVPMASGQRRHQRQSVPGPRGSRRGATAEPEAVTAGDPATEPLAAADPFDEIDFGSSSTTTWTPATRARPPNRSKSRRSRRSFPLAGHAGRLSALAVERQRDTADEVRDAAESIIGNLDEDGYVCGVARGDRARGEHQAETWKRPLPPCRSLDPAGVGARNLRECLLLQIESINGKGGVAWQIVSNHMRLLETRQYKEMARLLGRPHEHIEIAVT
jgi:RNA polymerase sigma-54 factor